MERTIDGVLVTFADITRIAAAEASAWRSCGSRIDTMLRFMLDMAERSLPHEAAPVALRGTAAGAGRYLQAGIRRRIWEPVPLAELAGRELAGFNTGREGRVVADGAPVLVRADTAVALGIVLHELAARAAAEVRCRYRKGRVHLDWSIEPADGTERKLVIRWRESGGPAGETQGGGDAKELIERGLSEQIGASLSVSPAEGGLTAEIALPLAGGLVLLPDPEGA